MIDVFSGGVSTIIQYHLKDWILAEVAPIYRLIQSPSLYVYRQGVRICTDSNRLLKRRHHGHPSLAAFTFMLLIFTFTHSSWADSEKEGPTMPYLAKWYDNKAAAVSLRFDDASETHVNTVIPILNRYGIKGTFMVNPGRRSYQKHRDFWEIEVPKMGHRLGNHTWRHKGAKTLEEAEREIGSVSELIWGLYPNHSKLNVFASGGGETWAGGSWDEAPQDFRNLRETYHLIDLYDGNHPSKSARYQTEAEALCDSIETAIQSGTHQPYSFHRIGQLDYKDWLRRLIGRTIYTFSAEKFECFVQCLKNAENDIWIGELVQVYKYETEYRNTSIETLERYPEYIELIIKVDTDLALYDQLLTLVIPGKIKPDAVQIIDDKQIKSDVKKQVHSYLVDLVPVSSRIVIRIDL